MTFETIFWIVAAILSAVVLWALMRKAPDEDGSLSQELSREALAEQLRVLDEERAAGLVTDSIYESSVTDVQRRALEELAIDEKHVKRTPPLGKTFAVGLSVVVAGSAFALYKGLGSPSLINFVSEPPKQGIMQADGTLGSTEGLYDEASLGAYLKDNGKDERAWVLYARLKVHKQEAADAYKKAVDLNGFVAKDANVLVEYAAALISQETKETYIQSLAVLDQALAIDSKLLSARELYAISSLELGYWTQARESIEYLLSQMSMDDPVYERLAQTGAYAAEQERLEAQGKKLEQKP